MVKLKFIVKDGSLVLRISEGKERYYKSVKHLLTGSPNLERHWNADKERFTCNAISYSENNKALEEFKSTYTKLLLVAFAFLLWVNCVYWACGGRSTDAFPMGRRI